MQPNILITFTDGFTCWILIYYTTLIIYKVMVYDGLRNHIIYFEKHIIFTFSIDDVDIYTGCLYILHSNGI